MAIEQLLGNMPKAKFVDDVYHKLPFSLAGGASQFIHLGSWATVENLLAQPDCDLMLVRGGRRWDGASKPSYDEARALHASGYTLLVRHADNHHAGLAELAQSFHEDFRAPVDVHIYCTPAQQHGFGWHYDAEDVFILQAHGRKCYSLRKNTVNPWPLVETIPRDMAYEREIMPLLDCTLDAGDWLYIPAGYWHKAEAEHESISLAVGIMSWTAMDAFDFLRSRLLASLLWRQRLPITGKASPLNDEELFDTYESLFAELGSNLAVMMRDDDLVRSFLARSGTGLGF